MEFSDYALIWWHQVQRDKIRYEELEVETWMDMRRPMRRCFLPLNCHNDVREKLVRLTQGEKSVEEYFKEMEM